MISAGYRAQVELLLRVIPFVAEEGCFALKGGTAINLFHRALPRLSVDIDLTYLPVKDRKSDLQAIADGLDRIKILLEKKISGIRVYKLSPKDGNEVKLACRLDRTEIKVEVNTILRGYLSKPEFMPVVDAVQDEFKMFAATNVVATGELYGGKICAALDRQHPRDLFDIHQLFQFEGITEEIKLGFIAALLGSSRPIHEMLRPNFLDQRETFETQFAGMSAETFNYKAFEVTRVQLVTRIHELLTDGDKQFLLSFKGGEPEWDLYPLDGLERMPAVQWKLLNINKLKNNNSKKYTEQLSALGECLGAG